MVAYGYPLADQYIFPFKRKALAADMLCGNTLLQKLRRILQFLNLSQSVLHN
jgi:hypothetical protein